MLVVAAFGVQGALFQPDAVWAAPLFVIVIGITSLLSTVQRYSRSPLLVGEPYWRKVLLVFAHGRKVRSAALAEREHVVSTG